jgi:transposase
LRARNSLHGRKEPIIPEPATLTPLLDALQNESVVVKLLFLRLGPQGAVSSSQREVARSLGISQGAVSLSLAKLRKLGLDGGKEELGRDSISLPSGEPIAPVLPEVLLEESQTTKLVYLYLKTHGEVVEVSVRQLEALLGISHRPAAEAIKRLVALELLEVLGQPKNRPGRYRID